MEVVSDTHTADHGYEVFKGGVKVLSRAPGEREASKFGEWAGGLLFSLSWPDFTGNSDLRNGENECARYSSSLILRVLLELENLSAAPINMRNQPPSA